MQILIFLNTYILILCIRATVHPWPLAKCIKLTVQFERFFRLMEQISVISCHNPINLCITEKLIKFSKSLFYFYLVISNK